MWSPRSDMSKSWFNGTVASTTFNVVDHQCCGVFFVNGFRGSEKTFVWNTLTFVLRVDPIQAIVESTYPSFIDNYGNHDYIRDRVVLAPTLDDVASTNEQMLLLLPGEESTYLSSYSVSNQDPTSKMAEIYTTEFVNTISGSGLLYIIS
ncbi:ATP-dependent DNA helicase pif1-like [Senna tora]|uniref:ATP-dependent DNA helicase pif1-like n=1 Tax=Senna tora TaxID=362788 RepID=A0A834X0A7_9FABA|nr:ATP-dependent DNA helicase pif1-like [Senna tora]